MNSRFSRLSIPAIAVTALILFVVTAFNTTSWLGTTFPGFFVLANRVVPSVSLPGWDAGGQEAFQHQVLAVDGVSVDTAEAVYEQVRQQPVGSRIRYTLRAPDGSTTTQVVASHRFSNTDYIFVFGAYLFCALVFIGTGLAVFWRRPEGAASLGLLSACLGLGFYPLTGADLYGPHWFFRLHVMAEVMFPAGMIHLALVFPTDRIGKRRFPTLLAIYLPFLLLALLYQCVLYWPSAYTTAHLAASAAQGLGGVALLGAVIYDRFATDSALVRWRIGVVGAGAVTAFIAPAFLTGSSGILGGAVPVNGAAFTAFIFPMCLGYAVLRRDLFETDLFNGGFSWGVTALSRVWSGLSSLLATLQSWVDRLDAASGKRLAQGSALGAAVLTVFLAGAIANNSAQWLGREFPGFFIMDNRVIPSISLPDWETDSPALFQHQVLAINGADVSSAAEAYELVGREAAGSTVEYTVRGPDGAITTEAASSRRFSATDYAALFGPFLFTGISFIAAGLLVFFLRPRSPAGLGMLSLGLVGGLFVLTAVDLYGPHWFFRLHILAEALVPASLIHLALVFPTNRLKRGYQPLLLGVYLACLAVAAIYQLVLAWPTAYSAVHLVAAAGHGIGGLVLIWVVTYDLLTTPSALVRRRILVAALGTVVAFLLPTVLMGASAFEGGSVPVNSAALTGFLFPLCFAYAIVKRDLLKIDVFLQRVALILIALMTSTAGSVLSSILYLRSRID